MKKIHSLMDTKKSVVISSQTKEDNFTKQKTRPVEREFDLKL